MSLWLCNSNSIWLCVCGEVWGSVVVSDGVARGGTGSVVVLRCMCLCVGRVASVVSVGRSEVAVGSTRWEKTGRGLSEIREG